MPSSSVQILRLDPDMERRFLILQARGNLSARIQQIRNAVRVRGLARRLPLIRHEREPKKNSPYFLFLGVDFELEQQEQALNDAFAFARSIGEQPYPSQKTFFTAKDIASMSAGKEIEVTGFWLQYKRHEEYAPPDPLDDAGTGTETGADRTEISDRLLFWISATGSGSWERLAAGAELLGFPRGSLSAVLRNLILLGHVEVSLDLSRWTAAPAAIVSCVLPNRPPFLAGQRTDATLEALAETGVALEIEPSEGQRRTQEGRNQRRNCALPRWSGTSLCSGRRRCGRACRQAARVVRLVCLPPPNSPTRALPAQD